MLKLYLDNCCYNRQFDNLKQEKINDEFTQKENYYNSILDEIKNSKTKTL